MIVRNRKVEAQQEPTQNIDIDISGAFQQPADYKNGARKHLNNFNPAGWWLNVDYVVAEVPA